MRFPKFILSASLCTSILMSHAAQAGISDLLEPSNIASAVKKQIAKAKIGKSFDLVNADVFDGVNIALKYKIESDPSYINGNYTRIDQYTLSASVNPWEIIDEMDMPIGFNISSGTDITFARQFPDQKKSLLSLPYTLKNLPLTAKKAIENLEVGDFVSFKTNMNLVFSASTFASSGVLGLSASDYVAMSGEFLVHMFRMPNNKMRLKFIATRNQSEGVGITAAINSSVKILGIKMLDKAIDGQAKKFINLTPFQLGINHGKNDLFMLDYVFNLNDQTAAKAYDQIMGAKLKLKQFEVVNPVPSKDSMEKKLFKDISEVESIFEQDKNLTTNDRRIDRVFKGSNEMLSMSSNFKFGLNILKFDQGASASRSKLTSTDRNNIEHKFIFETFSPYSKQNYIFGLYGDEELISSNLLFKADDKFAPQEFIVMSMARERKFKNLSDSDFSRLQKNVNSLLPASVSSQIDWKNWDFRKGDKVNAYFRNEVFFHTAALASMNVLPDSRYLTQLFRQYVEARPQPKGQPSNANEMMSQINCHTWVDCYDYDINTVGIRMAQVFNPELSVQDRYTAFVSLKNLSLFQERGAGFLLKLIPEDRLNEVIHYELSVEAKGAEAIHFRFGNFADEEMYKSMQYIQNVINNRSLDLRLYTDDKGELTPMQK